MSQVSHLKSAAITNLDAIPAVANTAGTGGPQHLKQLNDFVTTVAADAVLTTYRFVRIPSTAVVKSVVLESEAQGAGKVQVGLYYSDATNDGTAAANQGAVVSGCVAFFASDVDISAAVAPTNITSQAGNYTLNLRNEPIWQAAGLSADPGGFLDIVATVHTTAITTGAARLGISCEFAN